MTPIQQKAHPSTAEGVAQKIEGRDGCSKEIVRQKDEEPVLDYPSYVHCQCTCLANEQEHCLQCSKNSPPAPFVKSRSLSHNITFRIVQVN